MSWHDYVAMIEDTAVRSHIVEYREASHGPGPGLLRACALVDELSDGLSLVYSFFDPQLSKHSPGSFIILDHVATAQQTAIPYLYLGYWVRGSEKMDYKSRFSPIEILKPSGWALMSARDLPPRP